MNNLEYMQSVRKSIFESFVKNDEEVMRLTQSLSLCEQEKAVLGTNLNNCDQVIAILTEQQS